MNTQSYIDYMIKQTTTILNIDSPTGFTKKAAAYLMKEYEALGYQPVLTRKGGVLVDLGGTDGENALLQAAHIDTLGAMVARIKPSGNLELTPLGGMQPNNGEAENCRIYTRDGRVYEGTWQLNNASVHVNGNYKTTQRTYDSMEVVLDEEVNSADDTRALGIMIGDVVAFEPRTRITASGYIKSRFLDDKLSVGILLGYAKYLKEEGITPKRRVFQHFTVYEEVSHGSCGTVPEGVSEILSVDMGCVGDGLDCRETQVSICAKDSVGPYDYEVVTNLIHAAQAEGIDFAVDVYPHYSSDADEALHAGYDVKHGLIGAGVYASHGYERSHVKGMTNTWKLLVAYAK